MENCIVIKLYKGASALGDVSDLQLQSYRSSLQALRAYGSENGYSVLVTAAAPPDIADFDALVEVSSACELPEQMRRYIIEWAQTYMVDGEITDGALAMYTTPCTVLFYTAAPYAGEHIAR